MARQAGSAYVDFTARTTGIVTGMEKARAATNKAAREMRADIKEAKGSIALLGDEVGVKLPRHLQTFVAKLPGVAGALSSAFTGVAIIGLGMIAVEQAKKIYEAFEKMRELPDKITEDFDKLTGSIKAQNDELALQNIQLQNSINKFKGLPENKLAEQLAAATVEAVKLAGALNKSNDELEKLFKDNKVSLFGKIFMSMAGTGDVEKKITEFREAIKKVTDEALEKLRKDRDTAKPKDFAADLSTERTGVKSQYDEQLKSLNTQLAEAQVKQKDFAIHWSHGARDMTSVIKVLQGSISALAAEQDVAMQSFDNMTLKEEKAGQTGESAAQRQKEAIEAAAKAQKFRDDQRKSSEKWWDDLNAHRRELDTQLADYEQAQTKQEIEGINKQIEAQKRLNKEMEAAVSEALKGNRSGYAEQYAAYAESEQLKVETGQESNTQRIANLKEALATEQAAIQASLDEQAAMYDKDSKEYIAVQNEKAKAAAEYSREAATLNRDQLMLGIGGALAELKRQSLDTAGALREIFSSTLAGVNDQLVNLMSGKRTDFKGMFSGIASQGAKAGLQNAEGRLFGGLVKADGTIHNPFYVRDVTDAKKTGTDILSAAKGSPDPSTGTESGGLFGAAGTSIWGSILTSLIPHASGGPVMPGRAYLVGERGPEPFFPGVSGTVGTNSAMRSAFGGGGGSSNYHIPIDARGSNDPAAVNAAVHRAMRSYLPTMVGASAAYQHDMKRRVPPSSPQGA